MNLKFEIDDIELKKLILDYIADKTGKRPDISALHIQVKSKQNYKSEWEEAEFRAIFNGKF